MPLSLKEKEQARKELIERVQARTDLPFYAPENKFVYSEGPLDAPLMLIGEAPGKSEAILQRPFTGAAGRMLSKMLEEAGLDRSKLYITAVSKYRPPNNRTPTYHESLMWEHAHLKEEIAIIAPQVIMTLGTCATKLFLGKNINLTQLQGKPLFLQDYWLIPMFHPAYFLYDRRTLPAAQKTLKNIAMFLPEIVDNSVDKLFITSKNTWTTSQNNDPEAV